MFFLLGAHVTFFIRNLVFFSPFLLVTSEIFAPEKSSLCPVDVFEYFKVLNFQP